jgi:hypothetical protein
MISLSVTTVLLVLSVIAAAIGTHGRMIPPNVLNDAQQKKFILPFYATLRFYRSSLVNLAFAAISLSMTTPGHPKQRWWDWWDPGISVALNFLFVLVVAYFLDDRDDEMTATDRKKALHISVVGLIIYVFAIGAGAYRVAGDTAADQGRDAISRPVGITAAVP